MFSIFQNEETFGKTSTPVKTTDSKNATIKQEPLKFSVLNINDIIKKDEPIQKPTDGKLRVLVCGTYYKLYSGYSKVIFNLLKRLSKNTDIDITLYAFQNIKANNVQREDIPNIKVYDCLENENPNRNGFGEKEIGNYLMNNYFDIVIIYNDMSVVSMLMQNVCEVMPVEKRKKIKFVCYIDQVYQYQKERYISLLNEEFHSIIAFTDYWKDVIKRQIKDTTPVYTLCHGIDSNMFYPIPKTVARKYFAIDENSFVYLNVNRNQPRKRLDILCMAIAEIAKRHQSLIRTNKLKNKETKDIKFVMACSLDTNGVWNLPEILLWEFKRKELSPDLINQYIIAVSRPQQLSDQEINILYNSTDVNMSIASEGFGLSAMEAGIVGTTSIVSNFGGHLEYLTKNNSIPVNSSFEIYNDGTVDNIGGLVEIVSPSDVADAMWKAYDNPQMVKKLSVQIRKDILQNYDWDVFGNRLYEIIKHVSVN